MLGSMKFLPPFCSPELSVDVVVLPLFCCKLNILLELFLVELGISPPDARAFICWD